tara:strand:+ start:91 stop:1161 length:1071 start_codon:yes stop_codon:yes gene_type:complete
LTCSSLSHGQVTYTPVFIDECTNEAADVFWQLEDSEKTYYPNTDDFKSVELPTTGTYFLFSGFGYDEDPIEVTITKHEPKIDTLRISRLRFNQYVGYSNYTVCDSLANGHLKSYYPNGKTRMVGTFEDGQILDSLHEFYQNGQLKEVFITSKKGRRMTKYFENGNVQSVYDVAKREEKEYYQSGILKKENVWDSKYRHRIKEYDSKGNLVKDENNKAQKIYSSDGILLSIIKRKEILILDRIFSKDAYDRYHKFYDYEWESFDKAGVIKRKITFSNDGFLTSPFPDSVQQIDDYLFDKITFYQNGKEFKKIEIEYLKENQDWVYKLIIYKKENDKWIEEKRTTANKVYEIIASLSA